MTPCQLERILTAEFFAAADAEEDGRCGAALRVGRAAGRQLPRRFLKRVFITIYFTFYPRNFLLFLRIFLLLRRSRAVVAVIAENMIL